MSREAGASADATTCPRCGWTASGGNICGACGWHKDVPSQEAQHGRD